MIPCMVVTSEDSGKFGSLQIWVNSPPIADQIKDTLPVEYCVPCNYGQVYTGESKQKLEMRLKEHQDI